MYDITYHVTIWNCLRGRPLLHAFVVLATVDVIVVGGCGGAVGHGGSGGGSC